MGVYARAPGARPRLPGGAARRGASAGAPRGVSSGAVPHEPLWTPAFVRLVLGQLLQALGYASMLVLPLYLEHLGASRAGIGAIMATGTVGSLVGRPVVGWALDRVGRKPTILVGTLLLALGMAGLGAVDRVGPALWVDRVVFGLGQGALFASYFAFAADVIPAGRRTEGLALFGIAGLLPIALNAFVGRLVADPADLRWLYPAGAACVLASLVALRGVTEPPRPPDEPGGPGALRTLALRRLWPVWLATATFAALVSTFMAFVTVAARARGVPDPAALWLPYAAGAIGVRLVGARLPDQLGPHNLVAPALGLYVLAYVLASRAGDGAGFELAGACAGAAHGCCFPLLASQVVTRTPARWRGAGVTAFTAVWSVADLGVTPLAGLVADRAGDAALFALWAAGAAGALVAWAALEHGVGGELRSG